MPIVPPSNNSIRMLSCWLLVVGCEKRPDLRTNTEVVRSGDKGLQECLESGWIKHGWVSVCDDLAGCHLGQRGPTKTVRKKSLETTRTIDL